RMLKVPYELAGIGMDGERRIGIEVRARAGPARKFGVRNRRCGAPEDQIELGIVAAGTPERAALALRERHAVPGGFSRIAGPGNRVDAPQFPAGLRVMGGQETTAAGVGRRAS